MMSKAIEYLAKRLGETPEGFDPGAYLRECLRGVDASPEPIFAGLELAIGERKDISKTKMLTDLIELCFERKVVGDLPLLTLMEKAGGENDHTISIVAKSFKNIENALRLGGKSLLSQIPPDPAEMLAYSRLSKLGSSAIVQVINENLTEHAQALMTGWNAKSPRDYRSVLVDRESIYPMVRKALYALPLGSSHQAIRELFIGHNKPGHEEMLSRATAILDYKGGTFASDLPDLAPLTEDFLVRYESLILSRIFAKVVEMDGYEMDSAYEEFFIAGLRKLSQAGLNILNGVYTQTNYGYGIGYLDDMGEMRDPHEETRNALRIMQFGTTGLRNRERGYWEIKFKMRDTVCNHLLDLLPNDQGRALLDNDAYKLERSRFTKDRTCLNGLNNKALIDREFATDLGL